MYRHPDILENGFPIVHIGKLMSMGKRSERERTPFGKRMLEAREHAHLTQKEVQKLMGVSQSTLSGLEGPDASSSRTVEFARLYGCDPIWLATGEGQPNWGAPITQRAPRGGGEPPKPDFAAREWTESDWALLQDIKDAIQTSPARAELVAQWREEAARARAHYTALAEADFRRRVEAVQNAGGGRVGGNSLFGDNLGDAGASPPAPGKKEGGKS